MKTVTISVKNYFDAELLANFLDTLLIPASWCRNDSRKSKNKFEVTYEIVVNDKVTEKEIKRFIRNHIER